MPGQGTLITGQNMFQLAAQKRQLAHATESQRRQIIAQTISQRLAEEAAKRRQEYASRKQQQNMAIAGGAGLVGGAVGGGLLAAGGALGGLTAAGGAVTGGAIGAASGIAGGSIGAPGAPVAGIGSMAETLGRSQYRQSQAAGGARTYGDWAAEGRGGGVTATDQITQASGRLLETAQRPTEHYYATAPGIF